MSKLICITSSYQVGCTFLDWSINFLSGQTKFLNYEKGWIDLKLNPICENNAHGHQKNHPKGYHETIKQASFLKENSAFTTMYFIPMSYNQAVQQTKLLGSDINQSEIEKTKFTDFNKTLHWLNEYNADIIYVGLTQAFSLYTLELREQIENMEMIPTTSDFDDKFFAGSKQHWQTLGLTNIWDERERRALNYTSPKVQTPPIDLTVRHLYVDAQYLWYYNKQKIKDIMDWLNLKINQDRLQSWYRIYENWQQVHLKALKFHIDFEHIIDSIINGWDFPIDLTFNQEIIIQHHLIYKHNLNFKTWNLTKFPNNTKLLHKLLVANHHQFN